MLHIFMVIPKSNNHYDTINYMFTDDERMTMSTDFDSIDQLMDMVESGDSIATGEIKHEYANEIDALMSVFGDLEYMCSIERTKISELTDTNPELFV